MTNIKLSERIRSNRKTQTLTGKVEYVSGSSGNITQKGFEGPYAVISLKNEKTKVRIIGGDSSLLKIDDIISVKVGNPENSERGVWNTTIEAAPTVLKKASEPAKVEDVVLNNEKEPTVEPEIQALQKNGFENTVLNEMAILRWQRPTTDDKLAVKLNITKDKVVELTANQEYVAQVNHVLLNAVDTQDGKIKMKNYIRMAVQYRKVCVKQALARKMRVTIDDATSILERIDAKLT